MSEFLKITLVRSPIGYKKKQRVTAETLGLRKLHSTVVHRSTPQIRGMVNQIIHLLDVVEISEADIEAAEAAYERDQAAKAKKAEAKAAAKPAPEVVQEDPATEASAEAPEASEPEVDADATVVAEEAVEATPEAAVAEPEVDTDVTVVAEEAVEAAPEAAATEPDDLTKIEGIGPKMSGALIAAGIDTYAKLAASDEDAIRQAIEDAGMRLAPSLGTWAEQSALAAAGDWDGLKALQDQLQGGRRVDDES